MFGTARNRTPRARFARRPLVEALESREVLTTAVDPYLVPVNAGVETVALLTVGESVPELDAATDPTPNPLGHRLVGITDGLGAYDNGDGTITVLMHHELAGTLGAVRDHGATGAFVSRLIIDKDTKEVIGGDDLIKEVMFWDEVSQTYSNVASLIDPLTLDRLCSADLPVVSAFYDEATGLGTQERIFMSGEETRPPFSTRHGRGFATVVTGDNAGTSWELPLLGKMSFENMLANPGSGAKTIVASMDDSERTFASEVANPATLPPSEVYFYVGDKQAVGNEIEKAGLTNGNLFGLEVTGHATEGTLVAGTQYAFTLDMFNKNSVLADTNGEYLRSQSIAQGITQFRRVEDGQWNPLSPNDFYFTTTDRFDNPATPAFEGLSRLWHVHFNDLNNPAAGGFIEMVLDGTEGGTMYDNMTIDHLGRVLLQEDVGNQAHLGKVWIYDIGTDALLPVAQHNPKFFSGSALTNPDFITTDEESSGIIDASELLGKGWYLLDVQAHPNSAASGAPQQTGPELVEFGQFLAMKIGVIAGVHNGELVVLGTDCNDRIEVKLKGQSTVQVKSDGDVIATFNLADIGSITVSTYGGDDRITIDTKLTVGSFLRGGDGKDNIKGGSGHDLIMGDGGKDDIDGRDGNDVIVGGTGRDTASGGKGDDLLISGTTAYDVDPEALEAIRTAWTQPLSYNTRVNNLRTGAGGIPALDATKVLDDSEKDKLTGGNGLDWFWGFFNDSGDNKPGEAVN